MDKMKQISEAIVELKWDEIAALTNETLEAGVPALEIINQGLVTGMSAVGIKFRDGEVFLPELLLSAKKMKTALEILLPILRQQGTGFIGRVLIGTVSGDLHDIGRKIVASMLQGNGFEVIDLGIDVDPEKFVEAVRDSDAQILGLSALLTSTMPMMEATIKALEKAGLRQKVKVMVGGASVTQAYADRIGADGYGADAVAAVEKARALISTQSH
jgi:5-methyltetrahydrofolate--homocysteine methyltransferase